MEQQQMKQMEQTFEEADNIIVLGSWSDTNPATKEVQNVANEVVCQFKLNKK